MIKKKFNFVYTFLFKKIRLLHYLKEKMLLNV
jgi:hypothetical protein